MLFLNLITLEMKFSGIYFIMYNNYQQKSMFQKMPGKEILPQLQLSVFLFVRIKIVLFKYLLKN